MKRLTTFLAFRQSSLAMSIGLIVFILAGVYPRPTVTLAPNQTFSGSIVLVNNSDRVLTLYPQYLEAIDLWFTDCPDIVVISAENYATNRLVQNGGFYAISGASAEELSASLFTLCSLNDYQHEDDEMGNFQGGDWEGTIQRYEAQSWGLIAILENWPHGEYTRLLHQLSNSQILLPEQYRLEGIFLDLRLFGFEGLPFGK